MKLSFGCKLVLIRKTTYFYIHSSFKLYNTYFNKNVLSPDFKFRGLIAPVVTPFNDDEKRSLNLNNIPQYAKFLKERGIEGILVNGTSGEGMSMTVVERKSVAEAWKKAVAETKQHLMIQVGGAPLPDVLELASHSESIGVDSIMTLPELYFKPKNPTELIQYLKLVSEAAPKTPLLYYHNAIYSGVTVHMGEFLREAPGKINTFVGIKFTSTVFDEAVAARTANNGKWAVFLGSNDLLVGGYALGFDSAIASSLNMWPHYGIDILKQMKSNNIQEARKIQEQLSAAINIATKYGAWIPVMKAAVNLFTPINVGVPRSPFLKLTADKLKQLEADYKRSKLL